MLNKSSASPWVTTIARTGLVAKGVVYCLLGLIAFMAAFDIAGDSNKQATKEGVFNLVQQQAGGKIILGLIAAGLLCYCLWRAIQTFADTEKKGNNAKGLSSRIRYLLSGLVYLSFALIAIKMLFNKKGGNGAGSSENMVAGLLNKPFGQWMVGAVAVIIAGVGIYQAYYGLSKKYQKHVSNLNLHTKASAALLRSGALGYVSRGIVWLLIAYLMLQSAIHANAKEAGDTAKAFDLLEHSSYGSYLLGALGLGVILYGIFNFMRARYESFK